MFDVFYFGKKPNLFVFEKPANSLEHAAELSRTQYYWYIYGGNDYTNFDFTWRPAPWEETHLHVFPSQWQRNGDVYLANKNTVHKKQWHWRTNQSVVRSPDQTHWQTIGFAKLPDNIDYSWHPDSNEAPYIYHFSSQHQSSSGLIYQVLGATDVKFTSAFIVNTLPATDNWTVPEEIDSSIIDFSWHPNPLDPSYIYHFSSEWSPTSGLVYTIPGATEIKIVDGIPSNIVAPKLGTVDIFFVDRGNLLAELRYEQLRQRYPKIQKTRYANSMMDTIRRCMTRSSTRRFWVISSLHVYDDFDFTWHPDAWQTHMTHVFPSQWNKWSDTYLINKWEFERHSKWAKGIEEFPNLNFVKNQTVKTADVGANIYYVDHGNNDSHSRTELLNKYPSIKITRFVDNYLDTFKRIMATADTEYVWILNSVCDYRGFDFTWQPEPWQAEMIHVFPSRGTGVGHGLQKQGDTFYIHVPSFKEQMYDLEMLDWFNVINYCDDQVAVRLSEPVEMYTADSLVTAVQQHQFNYPYAVFRPLRDTLSVGWKPPCLWSEKYRTVEALNRSGSVSIVPRDVKRYLQTQIYDYPHVSRHSVHYSTEYPLDIVYISNGEPDAERWYHHLITVVQAHIPHGAQKIHRVQNVNGRIAAYHAAARASTTPWFFAVFAKLEVVGSFDWNWQPDYWQEPKHYIFHSRNCLNGLEYGHMGVIAYNKQLVLDTEYSGLDFTLTQKHTVVPELSAVAYFNADPWMTWRTAFREVIKLKHFMAEQPTLETEHRLDTWLTVANGDNSEWSLLGAQDAVTYYNEVQGEYEKLMLSFDWPWLRARFTELYTV
jgi:hypothetical protein